MTLKMVTFNASNIMLHNMGLTVTVGGKVTFQIYPPFNFVKSN